MPEEMIEPVLENISVNEGEKKGVVQEMSSAPEKEKVYEGTGERASEQYSKILSQVQPGHGTAPDTDEEIETDANAVGALDEAEKKVHVLLELAQTKGVAYAVRVARRMNDLYVLDTMHDELADKLYEGLLAKGLITKE